MPYNFRADVVRFLAERYDTKSNVKLGCFRSQFQASHMSSFFFFFFYWSLIDSKSLHFSRSLLNILILTVLLRRLLGFSLISSSPRLFYSSSEAIQRDLTTIDITVTFHSFQPSEKIQVFINLLAFFFCFSFNSIVPRSWFVHIVSMLCFRLLLNSQWVIYSTLIDRSYLNRKARFVYLGSSPDLISFFLPIPTALRRGWSHPFPGSFVPPASFPYSLGQFQSLWRWLISLSQSWSKIFFAQSAGAVEYTDCTSAEE